MKKKSTKNSENDEIICFRLIFEKYVVCFIDSIKTVENFIMSNQECLRIISTRH